MEIFALALLGVFFLGSLVALGLNVYGRVKNDAGWLECSMDVAGRSMIILIIALIAYAFS